MEKTNLPATQAKKLPAITDLYADKEMVVKENALNLLLNQPPNPEWISVHPIIKLEVIDPATGKKKKEPYKYIPIARLEWLMTRIFKRWRREILDSKIIANSVVVTMRVHYKDPLTGEWEWTDGIGAAPLQTDKDAGATDFNRIKSNAVQIGAPAAATFAFKNAIAALGKLFGKDLARNDEILYGGLANENTKLEAVKLRKEIAELLDQNQDPEEREQIIAILTEKEESGEATVEFYQNIINELKHAKNGSTNPDSKEDN